MSYVSPEDDVESYSPSADYLDDYHDIADGTNTSRSDDGLLSSVHGARVYESSLSSVSQSPSDPGSDDGSLSFTSRTSQSGSVSSRRSAIDSERQLHMAQMIHEQQALIASMLFKLLARF